MASAEPSSEISTSETREAVAADALSQLQTRQSGDNRDIRNAPPASSPVENTPLSSISNSSQSSFGYSSLDLSASGDSPTLGEIPSRSSKRAAPSTEFRSIRSRRGSPDSQYPPATPTTSAGAQSTPAAYPFSTGLVTPTFFQEPPTVKRRTRKFPTPQATLRPSTGARDDNGDARMHTLSAPPQRPDLLDLRAPLPHFSTFGDRTPSEVLSAGPASSLGYREHPRSSFPRGQNSIPPSPSMSARGYINTPSSYGHPSGLPRHPDATSSWLPASKVKPSTSQSTSLKRTFGLPPNPPPALTGLPQSYQNLPTLQSVIEQAAVQPSVDADGFMVLRGAVPVAQVQELVVMIANGLKVVTQSETTLVYGMPLQVYRIRDEFVNKWREMLRPFYDPVGKAMPKMPSSTQLCAFKATDPANVNTSIPNVGGKNHLLVHIAVTELSPENGFYTILRGSHQSKHPTVAQVSEWNPTSFTLAEGDALVWRGDVSYLRSSKGGGIWLNLNFDWGPGMVDLTTDEAN
ncbi:hypothetical protein BDR22DRAFT_829780 [Usnea florida]